MRQILVVDAGVLALHFAEDPRLAEHFKQIDEGRAQGLVTEGSLSECYY